jgi:hypothetical protein
MSELTYPAGSRLKLSYAPNKALQRTRSAPLRSPLSLKPFGELGRNPLELQSLGVPGRGPVAGSQGSE